MEKDRFSKFAGEQCALTYGNSRFVTVRDFSDGHFRGPRGWQFHGLPRGYSIDHAADGIGTKTVVITTAQSYSHAAWDLVAMTFGDITRWGGMPLILTNVLDVEDIGKPMDPASIAFRELILGLVALANQEQFVAYKGETAELGACVGSEIPESPVKFNWVGFATGVYHPRKMITGSTLKKGQVVVALREYGFRCNGLTPARGGLRAHFGSRWWDNPEAQKSIQDAATPSTLYDRFLTTGNGWYDPKFQPLLKMHSIVHLTGGSMRSKFAEDILFPREFSATLDNLWQPPEIMRNCAEWIGMGDTQFYETWNGGQGVLVVLDERDVDEFVRLAREFSIEAQPCGTITQEQVPRLTIASKLGGETVEYHAP